MQNTLWHRLTLLVRELGVPAAALYGLDRLVRRLHAPSGLVFYRFLAQPLLAHARLPPGRGRHFAFRLLQSADPALLALGRPGAVIAQRFAQGAQCLLATRDGALVGCIWFVRGRYQEDEVRVDYVLPEGGHCVWDFDVFVAPSERLGFLFARQWDALDALLRPDGVRYSVSRINAFNQRSVASHRSLGATNCGWALFVRVGPAQAMVSGVWPYVALGGRPRLHIGPVA